MKKHIKPIVIAILLVFMACLSVSAQRLIKDFGVLEKDFVDTIKIKMWDGAIIVPVEIEGKTKNLMFDTGANMGFWIGVHKGTKGYEKGIRTGDYLISVDGTPIADLCTYVLLKYNGKVKHHVFCSPNGEVKEIEW